jgi:uncharacterized tellurite resistance protein B-like protein
VGGVRTRIDPSDAAVVVFLVPLGSGLSFVSYVAIRARVHNPVFFWMGLTGLAILAVAGFLGKRLFPNAEASSRNAIDSLGADLLPDDDDRERKMQALRERDPRFDVEVLKQRVSRIFLLVQEALVRRNVAAIRPYVTDSMYQRFNTGLALARAFGLRDVALDVKIQDVRLSALEVADHFEVAHIGFRTTARIAEVPADSADEVALDAASRFAETPLEEVWSFIRRRGTKTAKVSLAEGKCPNCGAPFQGGATGRCSHCEAVVNSGDYDWVLGKVSQIEEFSVTGLGAPGLEQLRARDPDLAVELIEDRASLQFWRYIEAKVLEDPTRLRKVASAPFVKSIVSHQAELRGRGQREWFHQVSLNGVDVITFNLDNDGIDYANVRVRWAGSRVVGPVGQPQRKAPSERVHVLTLFRNVGARTDKAAGALTYRCWSCHGPLGDSDSTTCDYCNAEQVDGDHHWQVRSFETYERWLSRQPPEFRASRVKAPWANRRYPVEYRSERRRLLRLMVAMASADGHVDWKETRLLYSQARRWDISPDELEGYLRSPEVDDADLPGPGEAKEFLGGLLEIAAVDGEIDRKERQILTLVARSLNYSDETLDQMITRALMAGPSRGNQTPMV